MAPVATQLKTYNKETLRAFCEQNPHYQKYQREKMKKSELQAQLNTVNQGLSSWKAEWIHANNDTEKSSEINEKRAGEYIDKGIVPRTQNIFEELKEKRRSLQDQKTLIEGALVLQEQRVMLAKNEWSYHALLALRPLHRERFRVHLAEQFRLLKSVEDLNELSMAADELELPTHSLRCGVPWLHYPGKATDPYSGMRQILRNLEEDGFITGEERARLIQGEEFTP